MTMHMRTTVMGSILVLAALPAGAQAPGGGSPAAPAAKPLSGQLDAAGEGRRTFLKLNCYGCHGMFAAGGMGPNIVHAERGDVQEAVMQGEDGGMPSFRTRVSPTDIDNLTAYLKSIGTPNEPVFMDWWKKVPPK
jgi:mono/diheme cytochrome c family protein